MLLEIAHLDRSTIEIGSCKQIIVRSILNLDVVVVVLRIDRQNVKTHRMPKNVLDALLRLDLKHDQIVLLSHRPNNVLRRLFIAKKRIRNGIREDRHLIVCFAQFFFGKTRIQTLAFTSTGNLCHNNILVVVVQL